MKAGAIVFNLFKGVLDFRGLDGSRQCSGQYEINLGTTPMPLKKIKASLEL